MYKAAAYFSVACTRQENKGTTLSAGDLELNSEESRILAQNLATMREEQRQNLTLASNLCAGLSVLTKRLYFLKKYDKVKEKHLKAQYQYDIGRACHLKAKSLILLSDDGENNEHIENLQKKANYYFYKSEETWEYMIENLKQLSNNEKENLKANLLIVNEHIIENDVEIINENEALKFQDPEPIIIVPENLAPFLPRTTNYLTQYKPRDLNFSAYRRYKDLLSEISVDYNKMEELQNKKAGIGRTLKQLKVLYDNNDIDVSEFTYLFEKYSTKLVTIENVIDKVRNPEKKSKINKQQIKETKSEI
jgi:flagellar biosynthesis regulator FlaF